MRRLPIAPLFLVVVICVWAFWSAPSACKALTRDLGTLFGSAVHGKWDAVAARTIAGDLTTVTKETLYRAAHFLHLSLGQEPSTHAGVIIKGDVGEGTGFLVRMPDGPVVFTNYHVIAGNPHFKVLADDGSEIQVKSIRGASDRDIAMLGVAEGQYQYLELEKDVANNLNTGDDVLTPGNSEGGEVTLTTPGKVQGLGPVRVEIDNPIYHGNSGGPVINENTGKVVGIVEMAMSRKANDFADRNSRANPNSAITSDVRYFSLRIDTVPRWDTFDMAQVESQSEFLQNFIQDTSALASYLGDTPDPFAYKKNSTLAGLPDPSILKKMNDASFISKLTSPGNVDKLKLNDFSDPTSNNAGETAVALQTALEDCMKVAQSGMETIQNPHRFYAFQWMPAQEATDPRLQLIKRLQADLDKIHSL